MGRAIVGSATLLLVLLILGGMFLWKTRTKKIGDLSRREERKQQELLESAASIMFHLSTPSDLSEFNVLTEGTRTAVDEWRRQYSEYTKEITGA